MARVPFIRGGLDGSQKIGGNETKYSVDLAVIEAVVVHFSVDRHDIIGVKRELNLTARNYSYKGASLFRTTCNAVQF